MSKLESNGVTSPPIEIRGNPATMTYREECEQLRLQCSVLLAEIDRLRRNDFSTERLQNDCFKLALKVKEEQIAASQAREQQLREALNDIPIGIALFKSDEVVVNARKALALPQDTTTLEAMIQKAGGVMRGRCVAAIGGQNGTEAILALPGVTLEDLK